MKIKATKKLLSLVLSVLMLISTFTMMFAYAEAADTPVTTPKDYATATDGEKLWDVDFSSPYYVHVDDSAQAVNNGGTTYAADGSVAAGAKMRWTKSISNDATVVEENGAALKIDGPKDAIGTEGELGYIPAVPAEASVDSRYIGEIAAYDLDNKTYTYEFEYFRNGVIRSKFFFANGTFMNFGGCDTAMPNLALELATGYRFMRQSSNVGNGGSTKPLYNKDEVTGEWSTKMKVVLKGGEKIENVTLYEGRWLSQKANIKTWVGDAIPVTVSIYNTIINEIGMLQDVLIKTFEVYQPAERKLVFGIGEYNQLTTGQYYGARDLAIYKGDTSIPFDFHFDRIYDLKNYGEDLISFDVKGITDAAKNNSNGYAWTSNGGGITVDSEGIIYINKDDSAALHGAYTPHPFGVKWNRGYYEMELTVNNAGSFKIGLISCAEQSRVGFDILPNGTVESLYGDIPMNDPTAYLTAGNAKNLYVSAGDTFGDGVVNANGIKTIVYDTFADADADGTPEDPRCVRDYGGNRANVKIIYNCEDYIITLYEKCGSEWVAISAIDYSEAMASGNEPALVFDLMACDMNVNALIKNIKVKKGISTSHLHTYKVGDFSSDTLVSYDASFMTEFTAAYADKYGISNLDLGWTMDGQTKVSDFKAIYDSISSTYYGITTIKLAPIVNYDTLATDAVLRGIRINTDEASKTYDVTFISAISEIADVAAIGYDIVKTVNDGANSKVTETSIETQTVSRSITANGITYAATALGGDYAVSIGFKDEAILEGTTVTYEVTVYTIALDGTKTLSDKTVTYTLYEGEYFVD